MNNIHSDEVELIGFGGASTSVHKACYSTFGETRILTQKGDKNLIAHHLAEVQWHITHTPGCFTLNEWEHKPKIANRSWTFQKNEELYGDKLMHLRLTKEDFNDFMMSAQIYESINSLYQPNRQSESDTTLNDVQMDTIKKVQEVHSVFNHLSAQALLRMMESTSPLDAFGVTQEDIKLWQTYSAPYCEGCLRGKMKEHDRVPTTNKENHPIGTSGTADLMFIDELRGGKKPLYVHVDKGSKMLFGVPMTNKDEKEILRAVDVVRGAYQSFNHKLAHLTFDRESAVVSSTYDIQERGIKLRLKAAGQHSGLAEVSIAQIRAHARATKAGVRADLLYNPLIQWNTDLVLDTISTLNRQVRPDFTESPLSLFSGQQVDYMKDFRVPWGDIVLAKKPKGISSDLEDVSRWAIVVRRFMDGTGVLKVFILDTKRYAYVLKIARPRVPQRILDQINSMNINSNRIMMEDGVDEFSLPEVVEDEPNIPVISNNLEQLFDSDARIEGDDLVELNDIYDKEIREAEDDYVLQDPLDQDEPLHIPDQESQTHQLHPEVVNLSNWMSPPESTKRVSRPTTRMVFTLYHEAVRSNPAAAKLAMKIEIANIKNNRVWKGCKLEWLTPEEQKLILNIMSNYTEKFTPSGHFDKSKLRICIRGDQQVLIAETEGPVCRVETIFVLFSIAVFYDYEVFVIDFVSAYLNTLMPDEVQHRWVLLDPIVSKFLIEDDYEYWSEFLQKDGRILVELLKLMYGYKEAAHYWNKILMAMFALHGWIAQAKDKCLVIKHQGENFGAIAITVDDLTCVVTKGSGLKEQVIAMCKEHFVNITLSEGDTIEVIGMTFVIDRVNKGVSVSQRKFVDKTCANFNISKKSCTPCTIDLFDSDLTEPTLVDQLEFMLINSTAMYGGKRTYPEVLPTTTYLATKYWHATQTDMNKALRVLEYFNYSDNHVMYFRPKSLKIVVSADASYAEHHDAKSHTGGCIGFEGYEGEGSYFIFISNKQSIVAKSSCESELIALNTVAEHLVWLQDLLEGMGDQFVSGLPAIVQQDNTSTILIANRGSGTFKRTKHINVRYYWVKNLIDIGLMVLTYVPTALMVSDLLTKPIVGARFKVLTARLLGWVSMPK